MAQEEERMKNPSEPQASGRQTVPRTSSGGPAGKVISTGKQQFVIAPRRVGFLGTVAVQPLAFNLVEQTLRSTPEVEVVDTIGPRGLVGTLADGLAGPPAVIVARMTLQNAQNLWQQGRGELIVEPDQPLALSAAVMQQPPMVFGAMPASAPTSVSVVVTGPDNNPVEGAEVYLFGTVAPVTGVTDHRGQLTLTLHGDTPQSIRGIYIKPRYDYWSFYHSQPSIEVNQPNLCALKPLSSTLPNFPRQQITGWGQKMMRLDQLPPNYRGQGVKIAVVDSGAATTHRDLQNLKRGYDVVGKRWASSNWSQDTIEHGSHCAGIIAGDADNGTGIRGFAPDADVHVCRVFPGGQISTLIDALEYCIEQQVDVVHLSFNSDQPSEALEQHLLRAKRLGIACIVAAGNSGGPVQYPASSPNVLAVGAIGKLGEFPQDSYHTQTIGGLGVAPGGYFFPKFTAIGPEITVYGPGVAILSSVPPDNFAAFDGTSMAAAHITGLAGLVLAHHPDFQGPFRAKDARRVDALFQILRLSVQPLSLVDLRRGVPDALVALGLAPPSWVGSIVGQLTTPWAGAVSPAIGLGARAWF